MGYLDKDAATKLITDSEGTEFVVRTKADEEEFQKNVLDNVVPQEVDKKIGDRIGEIHKQYDDDIYTLTGKRKEATQKTYDFNKQIITELTQDAERYTDLKPKYDALEKSKGGEDLGKELKEVRDKATKQQEEYKQKIEDLTNGNTIELKHLYLDAAIAGLKFSDSITENVRKSHIEAVKGNIMKSAEIRDKTLVFLKDDGGPILNDKMQIKTAHDYLSEQLVDILAKEQGGLGLDGDHRKLQSITLPDTVTDENGVIAFMKTIPGLEMQSKEWTEKYKELTKELKK